MGWLCFNECAEAKAKVEASARRIEDLKESVKQAQAAGKALEAKMQETYDKMEKEKNLRIDILKDEIKNNRIEKQRNEERLDALTAEMNKMSTEHKQDLINANAAFMRSIKEKDEAMQGMMREIFQSFTSIMEKQADDNQRNFELIMEQSKQHNADMKMILERMDRRMAFLEKKTFGESSDDTPVATENFELSGAELYHMVEERKQELAFRSYTIPKWEFRSTGPMIAAAYAAVEAMASYSELPSIGH